MAGRGLAHLLVGVAVEQDGADRQLGQVVHAVVEAGAIDVAVGEEQLAARLLAHGAIGGQLGRGVKDRRKVGHAGEVEDHLVDLGLAVAAHADDLRAQGIEHGDDLLGGVALGKVIARAMVEHVTEQQQAVGLL